MQPTPVSLRGESPQAEGPGGLQSIGLHRVGHDRNYLACTHSWRAGLCEERVMGDELSRRVLRRDLQS